MFHYELDNAGPIGKTVGPFSYYRTRQANMNASTIARSASVMETTSTVTTRPLTTPWRALTGLITRERTF